MKKCFFVGINLALETMSKVKVELIEVASLFFGEDVKKKKLAFFLRGGGGLCKVESSSWFLVQYKPQ